MSLDGSGQEVPRPVGEVRGPKKATTDLEIVTLIEYNRTWTPACSATSTRILLIEL